MLPCSRSSRRAFLAVCGAALLAACSSGSSDGASAPLGTIAVTLTPGSVTVPAGSTGSVGVSVARGGGFDGPVTLTASGQPNGVVIAFGSSPVASGVFSTSMTVTVPAGVIPGTYTVTIRGAGQGASTGATAFTLRTT